MIFTTNQGLISSSELHSQSQCKRPQSVQQIGNMQTVVYKFLMNKHVLTYGISPYDGNLNFQTRGIFKTNKR